MAKLIKTDKNGTKYYEGYVPCTRCNGEGVYIIGIRNNRPLLSPVDSGICFKCGGSGKQLGKWKEYTPEYEAKLEERRRKRAEKQALEAEQRAKEEAERLAEIERERKEQEEQARLETLQAEIEARKQRAKSHYVGTVGERVYLQVLYVKTAWYEHPSFKGYGTDTTYIHTFMIGEDVLVWKTSNTLGRWDGDEWRPCQKGEYIRMKATIKEHSEYKGEKQTLLTRCKIN